jgi:rRNA maturation RNase YbeY
MIRYFIEDTDFKFKKKKICTEWIHSVLKQLPQKSEEIAERNNPGFQKLSDNPIIYLAGDVNIIFCSDEYLLGINKQYLKHNYYTDVITFDYTENFVLSGDIFVSIDTVKSNALEFKTDFKNELYRVIIHGILHLCGFKDSNSHQKKIMRELEDFALQCKLAFAI